MNSKHRKQAAEKRKQLAIYSGIRRSNPASMDQIELAPDGIGFLMSGNGESVTGFTAWGTGNAGEPNE